MSFLKTKFFVAVLTIVSMTFTPYMAQAQGSSWQAPVGGPPGNNTPAPVNVGSEEQTKTGPLVVSQLSVSQEGGNGLIVPFADSVFGYPVPGDPAASILDFFPVKLNLFGSFRYQPEDSVWPPSQTSVLSPDSSGNAVWKDITEMCAETGCGGDGGGGGGGGAVVSTGATQGETLYWDVPSQTWKISSRVRINPGSGNLFTVASNSGGITADETGNISLLTSADNGLKLYSNGSVGLGINGNVGLTENKVLAAADNTGKLKWMDVLELCAEAGCGGDGGSTTTPPGVSMPPGSAGQTLYYVDTTPPGSPMDGSANTGVWTATDAIRVSSEPNPTGLVDWTVVSLPTSVVGLKLFKNNGYTQLNGPTVMNDTAVMNAEVVANANVTINNANNDARFYLPNVGFAIPYSALGNDPSLINLQKPLCVNSQSNVVGKCNKPLGELEPIQPGKDANGTNIYGSQDNNNALVFTNTNTVTIEYCGGGGGGGGGGIGGGGGEGSSGATFGGAGGGGGGAGKCHTETTTFNAGEKLTWNIGEGGAGGNGAYWQCHPYVVKWQLGGYYLSNTGGIGGGLITCNAPLTPASPGSEGQTTSIYKVSTNGTTSQIGNVAIGGLYGSPGKSVFEMITQNAVPTGGSGGVDDPVTVTTFNGEDANVYLDYAGYGGLGETKTGTWGQTEGSFRGARGWYGSSANIPVEFNWVWEQDHLSYKGGTSGGGGGDGKYKTANGGGGGGGSYKLGTERCRECYLSGGTAKWYEYIGGKGGNGGSGYVKVSGISSPGSIIDDGNENTILITTPGEYILKSGLQNINDAQNINIPPSWAGSTVTIEMWGGGGAGGRVINPNTTPLDAAGGGAGGYVKIVKQLPGNECMGYAGTCDIISGQTNAYSRVKIGAGGTPGNSGSTTGTNSTNGTATMICPRVFTSSQSCDVVVPDGRFIKADGGAAGSIIGPLVGGAGGVVSQGVTSNMGGVNVNSGSNQAVTGGAGAAGAYPGDGTGGVGGQIPSPGTNEYGAGGVGASGYTLQGTYYPTPASPGKAGAIRITKN